MIKEDYLIRFITIIGRSIAAMLDKRKQQQPEESLVLARALFKEITGGNIDEVPFQLDEQQVSRWSAQITERMGDAAYETAMAYKDCGDKARAENFMDIALSLYAASEYKDKTFSIEREQKKGMVNNDKSILSK